VPPVIRLGEASDDILFCGLCGREGVLCVVLQPLSARTLFSCARNIWRGMGKATARWRRRLNALNTVPLPAYY